MSQINTNTNTGAGNTNWNQKPEEVDGAEKALAAKAAVATETNAETAQWLNIHLKQK